MVSRHFPALSPRLLGAVIVVAVGAGLAGCTDASHDTHPDHRNFAFSGKALTIDASDGGVQVQPADVKGVDVTRWFDAHTVLGETPRATWALEGGTLRLRTHCAGLVSDCSVRHRILVPRDVAVTVTAGNGRVEASGFSTPLKVTSDNGSVAVDGSSGALTLDSRNGQVVATGIRARQVHAGSSNGAVLLGFAVVPDTVDTRTSNGSVTVELPHAAYHVAAGSSNGATHVDVPTDPASVHLVSAHSANGGITVRTAG